ncbi:MAG: DUF418 domain-containing protein [Sphingomonas bacterium]|nr:DUF418 domain-containing protein [Sphingomonas bacterium]
MIAPLPATTRIQSLDVIRGVAVMGIFSVNVVAFAMIFPAYFNPGAYGGTTGENFAIWLVNYVVIDGKMRSLFSMLFGASMLLVIERAAVAGRSEARTHYARMVVLLLFGLFHFYFIWHGDILALYALIGMVAFFFRKCCVKTLLIWATCLMLATTIMFSGASYEMRRLDLAAHAPGATAKQIGQWNAMISFAARPAAKDAEETRLARGPITVRARHMLSERGEEPFTSVTGFGLPTLALMLFGMAGYRSGFFTGDWSRAHYRRIAMATLATGGLVTLGLGLWVASSNFYIPLIFFAFIAIGEPIQLAMAVGYAALIILLARSGGALTDRFAAVGRAAFSNYLGTSVLAALIFYGDGLGLFGKVSRFEAWLVVPLVWTIMLLWSKPWLERFRYGPLEWAWRSLARLSIEPMRKSPALARASA